jgi:hypothetical protein
MQLPDGKGVLVENPNRLAHAKFVQLVLAEFPQLHEELAEAEGLLHLEMGALSRFAQKAIEHNDSYTLTRCYELLAGIMKTAPSEVENAIHVSFLENLNFESSPYGGEARSLLPPVLRKALDEVNEHWERIGQRQVERSNRTLLFSLHLGECCGIRGC